MAEQEENTEKRNADRMKRAAWRTVDYRVGVERRPAVSGPIYVVLLCRRGQPWGDEIAVYTSRPRALRHATRLRAALKLETP